MSIHSYPLLLSLYKGEGRILLVPFIDHVAGYSIASNWYLNITDVEDATKIGESVIRAVDYIRNSPLCSLTPKERKDNAAWKKNTKYKSKVAFWKNNHYVRILITENHHCIVYSMERSEKHQGEYGDIIDKVDLSADSNAEEIGKAVIFTFRGSELFYKKHKVKKKEDRKEIRLLDDKKLTVKLPWVEDFVDFQDAGSAEIYQCYKSISATGDIWANIFLGIAPELDCDLSEDNICSTWEQIYGKADLFTVQDVDCGIFKIRAEMKNENTHRISYLLQMEEDLLLECGLEVHRPNCNKKLDEKLIQMFKTFVLGCSF